MTEKLGPEKTHLTYPLPMTPATTKLERAADFAVSLDITRTVRAMDGGMFIYLIRPTSLNTTPPSDE
jgi:hypothetical protein